MANANTTHGLNDLINGYENIKRELDLAKSNLAATESILAALQNRHKSDKDRVSELETRLTNYFESGGTSGRHAHSGAGGRDGNPNKRKRDGSPEPRRLSRGDLRAGSTAHSFIDDEPELEALERDDSPWGETPATSTSSRNVGGRRLMYPALHRKYGSVVELDGKVFAICCFVGNCRANSKHPESPEYFQGVHGLTGHIIRSHKDVNLGAHKGDEVVRRCRRTELSQEDADRVKRGEVPKMQIDHVFKEKKTSTGMIGSPEHDFWA